MGSPRCPGKGIILRRRRVAGDNAVRASDGPTFCDRLQLRNHHLEAAEVRLATGRPQLHRWRVLQAPLRGKAEGVSRAPKSVETFRSYERPRTACLRYAGVQFEAVL